MDFQLTHFFRQAYEDGLLIIDVIRINPLFKPVKESWLECFTEGLTVVIQAEAMELVPVLSNPEMISKDDNVQAGGASNNKLLTGILFEFCHSILLQFSFEELSQYPFWAAKVSLCTAPTEGPHLTAFISLLRAKYNGGLSTLFQGSAPYLVACYLNNIAIVELSLRRFFAIVLSGIPRSPSMLSKPGVTATSSSSSSLSSSLNPKYKRDFLYQNNEDPGRHLETFNNTGLNASSSDSQICPKQSKGFRNTRSSIIHENNQNNMAWRSNYDNNDSRERERDRDRGDKDKGAKNERERSVVKNGTDATRSNNNNNSNGNSSKADNKKLSKKDKDSNNGRGIMKEEGYYNGSGDLEVERGNTKQQGASAQKKKTGLNMIWAASAVSGDVSPTDEGVSEVVVERDCLNDIVVESDKSKRERSSPFFLGSSYNNSSSNTINIGLNIEISTSDQSLLSKGEAKKREIENTTSHFDCNGASTSDTPNGTNTMTEDDIDNDDDETDDVFVMDADIPFSEAGVTRKPSHTQSHSAAVACTGTTTGTIDNESEGSNSGDNVTEISDSADVSDNGSVNMDPKKSSSVPSSSRLLSSNPSFPARPPSSLSASSSLFASNPSSRLPPIGPVGGKKDKHKPACYFGTPGIFQRLCITALAHPFLVVSVKMVTNPELRNQNWIYSYVHIVTRSGFGGLYSGIRAALGSAVIPFRLSFLLGMAETVIYRCMLDQGIVGEGSPSVGILSAVTSAVVVHKVSSQEGIYGMLRYGVLSALQVAPGLCSFLLARSVLWILLGDTKVRKRQYSRRKEILEDYWRSCRGQGQRDYTRTGSVRHPPSPPIKADKAFFQSTSTASTSTTTTAPSSSSSSSYTLHSPAYSTSQSSPALSSPVGLKTDTTLPRSTSNNSSTNNNKSNNNNSNRSPSGHDSNSNTSTDTSQMDSASTSTYSSNIRPGWSTTVPTVSSAMAV